MKQKNNMSDNLLDDNLLCYLHLNPMYDLEQGQRYDQLVKFSEHFNKLSKNFSQYLIDGKKICEDINNIISSLQMFEIFCSNPPFMAAIQNLVEFHSGLSKHLEEIIPTVINPLKLFIKNDIDSINEAQKENETNTDKFLAYQ